MSESKRSWFVRGGRIHTMGPHGTVDALLVIDGKVSLVGSAESIRRYVPDGTPELDLGGKTVVPGFWDCHIHFLAYALTFRTVDLRGARTVDEALERVARAASRLEPGRWLTGSGWDKSLWGGFPSRHELDRAVPGNPVILSSKDGHSSWLNTTALRLCGLSRDTPDPPGGSILRDESGEPTGVLQDNAQELAWKFVPEPQLEEKVRACAEVVPRLWKMGLTAAHVPEDLEFLEIARKLVYERDLPFRFALMPPVGALPVLESLGVRQGHGDDWVWLAQVKIFKDGSLGSSTALLFEPYEHLPGYCGIEVLSDDDLSTVVGRSIEAGFGVAVHAIGDRAVASTLDCLGRHAAVSGARGLRHRIEHSQMVRDGDLPKFSALNVIASVQPAHVLADRFMADREWGKRSRTAYPFAGLVRNGVALAFGSDAPVDTPDPILGIHAAVNRALPGEPEELAWYPEQRIGVREALEACTKNAAFAAGKESCLGDLEPGKWADFLVLEPDPLEVACRDIASVRVHAVCIGGRFVVGV